VKRVLCLSHVLQLAFLALDEVDDIPRFAGCCCLYMEGVAGGSTCKSVLGPDVLASWASGVAAQTASLSLVSVWRL